MLKLIPKRRFLHTSTFKRLEQSNTQGPHLNTNLNHKEEINNKSLKKDIGKVLVVGGGISGLAACHYLQYENSFPNNSYLSKYNKIKSHLCESSNRCGGWIHSEEHKNFLFEAGPHSLMTRKGDRTLQIIYDLNLEKEMIGAPSDSARRRWIYYEGRPLELPSLSAFSFKGIRQFLALWRNLPKKPKSVLIRAITKEWSRPNPANIKDQGFDESVKQFFTRRFGSDFEEIFVDPFIAGIYGAKSSSLSVRSCFPFLFEMERDYGSLTNALLFKPKTEKILYQDNKFQQFIDSTKKNMPVYSFINGSSTLSKALFDNLNKLPHSVHESSLNYQLDHLVFNADRNKVTGYFQNKENNKSEYEEFDSVIFATPANVTSEILTRSKVVSDESSVCYSVIVSLGKIFSSMSACSMYMSHLGFLSEKENDKFLDYSNGFGILIPSIEKEQVLGITFDSLAFPQQDLNQLAKNNYNGTAARLSVFIGGGRNPEMLNKSPQEINQIAVEAVQRILKPNNSNNFKLDYIHSELKHNCIPQYTLGHLKKVKEIDVLLSLLNKHLGREPHMPVLSFIGASLNGVSINDCITSGELIARKFHHH